MPVGVLVDVDSASSYSSRKRQARKKSRPVRNRGSLHGNHPLAKLYASPWQKVPEIADQPSVKPDRAPVNEISHHAAPYQLRTPSFHFFQAKRWESKNLEARIHAFENQRPNSVVRGLVFLAAGRKQNRRHKHREDDEHNEKRGRNVHRARLLVKSRLTNSVLSSQLSVLSDSRRTEQETDN
jgi:hypothetical protein